MSDAVKPVANIDEVQTFPMAQGDKYHVELGPMRPVIGSRELGAMLHVLEPGKAAFPFHVHHRNEEMFVVMEGQGTYRFGDERYPVRAGDVLAAPTGGPEVAHQIINTGDTVLKYLGISTMKDPEVIEYPDSGKVGMFSQSQDGSPMTARIRHVFKQGEGSLDYWDGEEGA